ncbi:MAG: ABC transporter permease subunit [Hyphomicrobiales bacterium]|nr:ABC transporter permease subunit [Hyphomicrobiales bacterium]
MWAVWSLAAYFADPRYLPSPAAVFAAIGAGVATGDLPYHVGITLLRVAASFLIAMFIGSAIGILMGRWSRFNLFFDSWLTLFLNLPALVTIILCYIWFGLYEAAAITAVALNKIPNVAVTMREGARALSADYSQMARVYRFGRWRTFRHVTLPQLAPFFAAATRSGLALVWKIVLVVELLGRSNGVGFQLYLYFQQFDVTNILAYAIAFIAVVQAIELFILQPWERSVNRWRR